jgi:hypothetical protein
MKQIHHFREIQNGQDSSDTTCHLTPIARVVMKQIHPFHEIQYGQDSSDTTCHLTHRYGAHETNPSLSRNSKWSRFLRYRMSSYNPR